MTVSNIRKDIKKDDVVIILSGNYKKNTGKVLKVFPKLNKLMVEGINKVKKHQKPSGQTPGGIIDKHLLIDASNVALFDKKENKALKITFKENSNGIKSRVNKKTGKFVD